MYIGLFAKLFHYLHSSIRSRKLKLHFLRDYVLFILFVSKNKRFLYEDEFLSIKEHTKMLLALRILYYFH